MQRLTEAEKYRRWIARRWFHDGYGWTPCYPNTKKENAALDRFVRDGYVEKDDLMFRLTDLGRDALGFPKL